MVEGGDSDLVRGGLVESGGEEPFKQWSADNVDHNLRTLTGKGTFHGMGIVSMSSREAKTCKAIKRLKKNENIKFAMQGLFKLFLILVRTNVACQN